MTGGPSVGSLDSGAYDHRLDAIASALHGRHGEVSYGSAQSASGESRKLQITVTVPGWGLPTEATMVFVEKHALRDRRWMLYEYAYDLHREPRPGGRYAFHWAREVFHVHCEDPERPGPDHHFKGAPIDDVYWVADTLFDMVHRGISCRGLQPLARWQEEPNVPRGR